MFHVTVRLPLQQASNTINNFDPLNIFELVDSPLTHCCSITCARHDVWHALALERAMPRTNCEAVMWKITTRGFTLEEVLIMAAMNLLTSAETAAKRENRASQKSKGDQACNCSVR